MFLFFVRVPPFGVVYNSQLIHISYGPSANKMPFQAEFFIKLREIEKVLPSTVQAAIKQDVMRMWETDRLEFVNITSALDRGGRVPLPLAGHYEGCGATHKHNMKLKTKKTYIFMVYCVNGVVFVPVCM